ncbi:hypothetical protein D9M72_463600 [compost metagenome]
MRRIVGDRHLEIVRHELRSGGNNEIADFESFGDPHTIGGEVCKRDRAAADGFRTAVDDPDDRIAILLSQRAQGYRDERHAIAGRSFDGRGHAEQDALVVRQTDTHREGARLLVGAAGNLAHRAIERQARIGPDPDLHRQASLEIADLRFGYCDLDFFFAFDGNRCDRRARTDDLADIGVDRGHDARPVGDEAGIDHLVLRL